MQYDFDEMINRKNTCSIKYDFKMERGKPDSVIPLWIADMDFRTPPAVVQALVKKSRHGIFGYTESKDAYAEAVSGWFKRRFDWQPEKEWLIKTPGIVHAVATSIRAFTQPGEAVLVQQPVYAPLFNLVNLNKRQLVNSPLVYEEGHYRIDFADFEAKIKAHKVRMFLMCSPHNPVGRVWTRAELEQLIEICLRNDVIVVSDEIHADFVYSGHRHFMSASLDDRYLENVITCTAPSKTFNLAGLQISNIFIPNATLRRSFISAMNCGGYNQPNTMGLTACEAAYNHGEEWLDQLLIYLQGNLDFVREYLQHNLPQVRLVEPGGTYLLWLDFGDLFVDGIAREKFLLNEAGLWLSSGSGFGPEGSNFERLNIACPRALLAQAMHQLQTAFELRG